MDYADTATHLHIFNKIYTKNTLVSTFNHKLNRRKIKLTSTAIYRGRDRMDLAGELDLFDDGTFFIKQG